MEVVRVMAIAAMVLIVAVVLFCGGAWYYVGRVNDTAQSGRDAAERARQQNERMEAAAEGRSP